MVPVNLVEAMSEVASVDTTSLAVILRMTLLAESIFNVVLLKWGATGGPGPRLAHRRSGGTDARARWQVGP